MAVLGGASWLLGALLRDVGLVEVDLRLWVERGTGSGATAGFAALVFGAVGVT
jgi:hypothetical protein